MQHIRIVSLGLGAALLLVGAGCARQTSTDTNVNTAVNVNLGGNPPPTPPDDGASVNVNVSTNVNVNTPVPVPAPVPTPAPVKKSAREIKVTAKQFEFVPSEIRVKVGEKIKLTLTNQDVPHSIAIPALGVNLSAVAGGTASTEFTADKAGEYPFFCSVFCGSGHREMKGKIIVE